jgi:hypothetical protein
MMGAKDARTPIASRIVADRRRGACGAPAEPGRYPAARNCATRIGTGGCEK